MSLRKTRQLIDKFVIEVSGEMGSSEEKKALFENGSSKAMEAVQDAAPLDKYNIVYMIMLVHGIGILMPWNMFITANDYFTNYKLNSSNPDAAIYQKYFLSYLGFTAQIPNVILNGVNLFCQVKGGSISKRIIWSIIVVVVMFILTVVLAMVDSSDWPAAFFFVTMASVVIINMANGIYQNSVYGTAAFLPMKYTNAVVLGSNISGTLTTILALISLISTPDTRTSAIYYFLAAIVVLLLAFDTYFALPLLPFYRFYKQRAKEEQEQSYHDRGGARPPYWEIFKKCWVHDLSVFFVFFVTLSSFPAIQASVVPISENFFISEKFFSVITCFLFFNLFAMLGNLTTEFIRKPGPRWLWIPVVLRALFLPFFLFSNYKPDIRSLPVLIQNDYVYCIASIFHGFSSGYLSSLCMMYAPTSVKPEHQGVAGMMAAFFLIIGIFGGVLFSFAMALIIENA
ncbi:hypothetical protein CAPTEDRAFT_217091 [Capitella teleta]|uniref:Equilibrative nucleoside transporter 3 n=1 Tax=Capitella teleta TaxID=283909 RepID=R7TSX2_CAPTE|nr:hypothetical protein CAPTEDRAFT_217091 [Capitella teleta]|eukprot:ELT94586.1 hypothetical protein CAPTEDRAFT_217091 [Capitella teleta]